jgi:hypothetical protein
VAERFWPNRLYRLKRGGHRVTIVSFDEEENGAISLKVRVSGEFNAVIFERTVFGIKPEDLEECDLPEPGEILGSLDMSDLAKAMYDARRKAEN